MLSALQMKLHLFHSTIADVEQGVDGTAGGDGNIEG
jgi:hypothetical protein